MRIDSDTEIFGTPAPVGAFHLTGIGSQFDRNSPFDEGYQIIPRFLSDIDVVTSTVDRSLKSSIKVYPNPAFSTINIETIIDFDQIFLSNSLGQKLFTFKQISGLKQLNVNSYPEGIYNLTFMKNESIWTERVLIK